MNKSILRNCTFILLLLACAQYAALASTLEGTVLDPSGKPVPGARISLLRSLTVIEERQADARGVYKFEGLQEGPYQLAASARGLACPAMNIEVRKDGNQRQDLNLALSALESQVVVSASLGGALAPQIGSSVSLVSKQDIDDRSAQNALEVIRGIPGIEVSQAGRRGGVTGVYIRGGESKYNAVMVDGIPLNEFGGSFDMASLPADGIERVEITRGPQSALYGSNAVTGVINIISRRGEGRAEFHRPGRRRQQLYAALRHRRERPHSWIQLVLQPLSSRFGWSGRKRPISQPERLSEPRLRSGPPAIELSVFRKRKRCRSPRALWIRSGRHVYGH